MTYRRILNRHQLTGEYQEKPFQNADGSVKPQWEWTPSERIESARRNIAGDLRRLEIDSRDPLHLASFALLGGITAAQVKKVLDAFFDGIPNEILAEVYLRVKTSNQAENA